jgi:hypothetical protein
MILPYTSGFLSTAICSGAVVPVLSGTLADHFGIAAAFTIPSVAYAFIAMCATIFFPLTTICRTPSLCLVPVSILAQKIFPMFGYQRLR